MTRRDRGASAVEYGLLVAAITAIVVVAVFSLGGIVRNAFTATTTCLSAGAASTC